MGNRVRPRCKQCNTAMSPLYGKGPLGKAFIRIRDAFWCPEDGQIAKGRRKVTFL